MRFSATGSAAPNASTTITADDITQADVPTAYEAINKLQRWWFNDPANQCTGTCTVLVYMNEQKQDTGTDGLRQLPAGDIAKLEYINGKDALVRYGQDAAGGVIIITRK